MRKIIFISWFIFILLFLYGVKSFVFAQPEQNITSEPISVIDKNESIQEPEFPTYDIPLNIEYQKLIWEECKKYNLSYELALAIILQESEFDHLAISDDGRDKGLFQLRDNTYPQLLKELNLQNEDIMNPVINIKCGVYNLSKHRNYWQSQGLSDENVFTHMIISYRRGVGGAYDFISRGSIDRSVYLQKIIQNKNLLENPKK